MCCLEMFGEVWRAEMTEFLGFALKHIRREKKEKKKKGQSKWVKSQ